jgi:hypothetical protein
VAGWLRGSRTGLLVIALVTGAGSGLGAVMLRYLISLFTWLATGHGAPNSCAAAARGGQTMTTPGPT